MANSLLVQTLEEGRRNAVIKITGILDTSDVSVTDVVDVADLDCDGTAPVPTQLRIDHIDYSIADQLEITLWWDATADVPILPIAGRGKMSFWNFGGVNNNSGTGKTGKIQLSTSGWTSGTQVFSIILELVKQGADL